MLAVEATISVSEPSGQPIYRKNAGILVEIWNRFFLTLWWKVIFKTWCFTTQKRQKLVTEMYHKQRPINHWANRANARGLALLGSSRLDIKKLLYWFFLFLGCSPRVKIVELFYHCVWHIRSGKLVTLAFIVFEWLKKFEPNSTALYDPKIRSKSLHPVDVSRNFSRVGQRPNFAYPLQVTDDAMQMDVHKTLYPFYPISLCWLNLNSQSVVWNIFCTSASRNAFLFINCPISIFRTLSTNKS